MIFENRLISSGLKMSIRRFFRYSAMSVIDSPFESASLMMSECAFEVAMMIVFVKSTVRPRLSVSRPSSNTCRNKFKMSGNAFSNSSSKIRL